MGILPSTYSFIFILFYNDFYFSIIVGLHCSVNFLLYSNVTQLHIHVYLFFFFLGPRPWHMKVPRLGVESELQLLAYATALTMQDPSHVCNLHHSSQPTQILNSFREARDGNFISMGTSWVCYHRATMGSPYFQHILYMRLTFCYIPVEELKS